MKQLSSAQVRQMWLDFWASKGHAIEPSVSLVPVNDPFQKIHELQMRRRRFGRTILKMSEKQRGTIPCLKC